MEKSKSDERRVKKGQDRRALGRGHVNLEESLNGKGRASLLLEENQ